MLDKIKGTLYGQALGDAMGMPAELWSRKRAIKELGVIKDFMNGPSSNIVSKNYKAGEFTDDTAQALVIIDTLNECNFVAKGNEIAKNLLKWAIDNDAFENNILGPTSKLTLTAISENKDTKEISDLASSNGAAMRIAPIGCLFNSKNLKELANFVYEISSITHSSDITICSATLVAAAVCIACETSDTKEAVLRALETEDYALSLGAETFNSSLAARIRLGIIYAEKFSDNEDRFLKFIYDIIGTSISACESIPAALLIAYYAGTPERCALLCANLGGDTDTIGAMATAICGAATGFNSINSYYIDYINRANNVDFDNYAKILENGRNIING